ncbi:MULTISPECIES: glycerophosphodiester phosphodiesterase [unclassified Lentimonas]|uniref:glycerophosphodiester phosphodiesterase n=1 Tax=unclassified Lentimonas TaxID=2630993 RepID=UPI00132C5675|nr:MULTISPECIES: glycerophosphodiester phosphodiesterase [unclassified Lentimonas]CAA6678377.1 Glycerophosphoryl diester phosphodiesterase (EC [Lentimonas sp. CC4]CAA6685469.1 Glycerophosphoryl diester phosphodiesterase (EC [Lentimonas sp. CC6]CAA6690546.1 Glycerophosphoryl diester phosphodiesterase (EC [Lentimonas sp. CC10]CAA6695377.1 Glycerophosphoryl diester phosphodiesterase (EC [Lentimonas sp. CC19]CAA7068803.1 Glycerophosphoryl diester phosphodiesterase (EC [Lentimonas sp. CC11]
MSMPPQVIAHRGASADAAENTMPAFELAWRQGADGVECDVRLTADCQVVCIHDADTERVAGKLLSVENHSYADLQALDVGSWKGEEFKESRIPLLSELLAASPSGKQLLIEVKTGVEILPALLEVLDASTIQLRVVTIIAFDVEVIRSLKQQRPELHAYWLIDVQSNWLGRSKLKLDDVLETLIEIRADGVGLRCHSGIHREMVHAILSADLALNIWTVDDATDARRFATFGVTSITSNEPAAMLVALFER